MQVFNVKSMLQVRCKHKPFWNLPGNAVLTQPKPLWLVCLVPMSPSEHFQLLFHCNYWIIRTIIIALIRRLTDGREIRVDVKEHTKKWKNERDKYVCLQRKLTITKSKEPGGIQVSKTPGHLLSSAPQALSHLIGCSTLTLLFIHCDWTLCSVRLNPWGTVMISPPMTWTTQHRVVRPLSSI